MWFSGASFMERFAHRERLRPALLICYVVRKYLPNLQLSLDFIGLQSPLTDARGSP